MSYLLWRNNLASFLFASKAARRKLQRKMDLKLLAWRLTAVPRSYRTGGSIRELGGGGVLMAANPLHGEDVGLVQQ